MRILIVVNVYRPDLGGGVLFSDLSEGLAERGFQVTVRCAYPYYPEWADKTGRNDWQIRTTRENGVRVERYGIFIPPNPSSLPQRLLYEASFFLSLARSIPDPDEFDAVMAFCPLVGGVGYGALAARAAGCPLWLNVQDLAAEAATASGMIAPGRAASLMLRIQRWLFNRAGTWSTIAPAMKIILERSRSQGQTVHLLPNWPHASLRAAAARVDESESGADVPKSAAASPPRLFYSGNVGGKQDLLRLCHMLRSSPQAFEFLIQAGGTEAGALGRWVGETADGRFSIRGLSDETAMVRTLARSDFFVITEKSGSGGAFIPSKLLAALAVGTPVVAVCDESSPLALELAESGAGYSFGWDAIGDLPGWLAAHGRGSADWSRWRERALQRADHFDRDRIIDRFAEELNILARRDHE